MIILFSTSHSPAFNLAAEEYLFGEKDEDLVFLYVNRPSVIIGCNQVISKEVDLEFCAANHIEVVRRMSGGGAVYHDNGNLNYCFISNRTTGASALGGEFLEPIIQVLDQLDIPAQAGKRKDLWLPNGFKISGTASHVGKNRELHHGTLLYDANLEQLQKSLSAPPSESSAKGIASVPSPVKNIRTFLAEEGFCAPNSTDFVEQIKQKLLDFFGLANVSTLSNEEINRINDVYKPKYENGDWTFRK